MSEIIPIGNRVLVKHIEKTNIGSIVVPESALSHEPHYCEVVQVPLAPIHILQSNEGPVPLKVGDKCIYSPNAVVKVHDDNEKEFILLREDNLLAIII
jgi:co-chaperonin GroES (HSP10)